MTRRVQIIFVILGVLMGITAVVYGYIRSTTSDIKLVFNPSMSANVSLQRDGDDTILRPESNISYTVRKGTYILKIGGDDITPQAQKIVVDDESQTIDLTISFTQKRLTDLRAINQPMIQKVLSDTYPGYENLYTLRADSRLYLDGTWFGGKLRYKGNDASTRDTLYVVMQKRSGMWALVTRPPQILVTKKTYPQIPSSVIEDLANEDAVRVTE